MLSYISFSVKTTSIDPEKGQVIEVACVADDLKSSIEKLQRFHTYVIHEEYKCSIEALNLESHKTIFKNIKEKDSNKYSFMKEEDVAEELFFWLQSIVGVDVCYYPNQEDKIKIIPTGYLFNSFDRLFLEKLPYMKRYVDFGYDAIDPISMYIKPQDKEIPSLCKCCVRANIEGETNEAINQAETVIKLIRSKLGIPISK